LKQVPTTLFSVLHGHFSPSGVIVPVVRVNQFFIRQPGWVPLAVTVSGHRRRSPSRFCG
jgi:hypothetical protein